MALGVNSRTWKLYAEYGDGLLRPLGRRWLGVDRPVESFRNSIDYLLLLNGCEVDMAPPRELVAALAECIPSGQTIAAVPIPIFRGGWRAYIQARYRNIDPKKFIEEEFIPVIRWFFEEGQTLNIDSNRIKAGWSWLRGQWAEVRRRRALPATPAEWASPLRNAEIGSLLFVPLQSTQALEDEGKVMKHCIASFRDCCEKGCLHVFSVRDSRTLDRVATAAIRARTGTWVIADIKSEGNRAPDESVVRAATSLLVLVKKSAKPASKLRPVCGDCLI